MLPFSNEGYPHLMSPLSCLIVVYRDIMSKSSVTPWAVAHQSPLSMARPRQKYWNGLLFPSPGDLPDPGVKAARPVLAGAPFTTEPPGKPLLALHRSHQNTACLLGHIPWWLSW